MYSNTNYSVKSIPINNDSDILLKIQELIDVRMRARKVALEKIATIFAILNYCSFNDEGELIEEIEGISEDVLDPIFLVGHMVVFTVLAFVAQSILLLLAVAIFPISIFLTGITVLNNISDFFKTGKINKDKFNVSAFFATILLLALFFIDGNDFWSALIACVALFFIAFFKLMVVLLSSASACKKALEFIWDNTEQIENLMANNRKRISVNLLHNFTQKTPLSTIESIEDNGFDFLSREEIVDILNKRIQMGFLTKQVASGGLIFYRPTNPRMSVANTTHLQID